MESQNSFPSRQIDLDQISSSSPPLLCYKLLFASLSICNELDRIFKKIWWGFPSNKKRNLSLKPWDSLCIPKPLGGLGLRKMREVNLALISKLGWKLLTNLDSLWVSQMHCKYLNSSTFLSPLPLLLLPHGYGKAS